MNRQELLTLLKAKGISTLKGEVKIDLENDLPQYCAYVDTLLASSMNTGRCAKLFRNLMVTYAAQIPQREDGRDYLFEPEAICETIMVLEGKRDDDRTKGPFEYEKGPLAGLRKKHFFQASFLAQNILNEIEKEGTAIIYRKLSEYYGRGNYEGKVLESIDASLITTAFSHDTIERRAARRAACRSQIALLHCQLDRFAGSYNRGLSDASTGKPESA